jgi:NAD(P)-dependent dehydrogenase (short-subunit alcohol dehydrogenase family)/acyl carrier protein
LLLSVVAEKTGYPAEMLDMGMQLEGDLGIDSIKRVEILSAMMELRPDLPEVDPAAMAGLRTLGQIVEYLGASLGEPAAEPAPVPIPPQVLPPIAKAAAPSPTPPPASMGPDLDSVTTLLLQVVAEKTGYPAEMLDMGMQLEGDLGIDSIKRVEILSAMMELRPDLPEVDPVAMAGLRTLDQIVEYLGAATSVPATSATPTPATPTPVPVPIPTPVSIAPAPAPTPIPAPVVARPPPAPEPQISLRPADHGLVRTVLSTRAQGGPGLAAHGLHGTGTMLIVDDGSGIAVALTEELRHRGVKAHMIQELDRLPRATSGLIFLGGLAEIQSTEQAIQINRQAFQMARLLGQGLTESGLFVTVQDTGGDFGISGSHTPERAWLSGLAGLARTASQEWASLTVRAIDLERGERSARELGRVLCEELLTGGSQLNTGLRASGERLILIDEEIPVMTGAPCLEDGDLVVVSGGARGVTAATVIALAQRVKARFLLLGRSAAGEEPSWAQGAQTEAELKRVLLNAQLGAGRTPHPREIGQQVARVISLREMQATLDAVNATGAEAIYASVSVTDVERLEGVLEAARSQWGPVKGLIHGAGVIADKLIVDKSAEDFNRVFDTKVLGLKALLDATKSDPLSLLCLFSSVAARTGNRGQCDYAMANEILNKVAQMESRQRSGCRVCALGWGPWEGGMVRPQLKARFKAMGVPLIPLPVGARMLVDEICSTQHDQVELILGGPPREGALLQDGDENPCVRHEVLVNRESHPYLHSHAIEGTPVIPVVLVAEWFLRTARMVWGTETELELTQLRVLRGVRLDSWETTGHRLVVSCEVVDPTTLVLELRGPDGILHYSANAVEGSENLSGLHPPLLSLQPWGERPVYGDVLFHGPKFQVIQSIEGIGEEGISGQLSGLESAGWSEEPWISDVASLDGALQLALLWSAHQHGLASLPTRIECLHWWEQPVPHARVRAILTKREISGNRTLSDVLLVDDEGSPIAELCGVETHALPRRSKAASS